MDKKLLDKFLRGESTLDELKLVLAWYSSTEADPGLEAEIEACFHEKYSKELGKIVWKKKQVFNSILKQIEKGSNTAPYTNQDITQPNIGNKLGVAWWLKVAASLVFVCGIAWWVTETQFDAANDRQSEVSEPVFIQKSTMKGQKLTLKLPDGTHVKLNADSRITFQENFNQGQQRIVKLEGEAFFDVVRDTARPFIIQTGKTETTVLGTSFNVRAYPQEENISVAVLTGKVHVDNKEKNNASILLLPGEKSVYKKGKITKAAYDYDLELGWKDGLLHFENADFGEIATKVEHWYGKKVVVQRTGIPQDFTGTYNNKSLKEVLDGMSYVLGFDYEITKNEIIIK